MPRSGMARTRELMGNTTHPSVNISAQVSPLIGLGVHCSSFMMVRACIRLQ